ncbi:MAG TPA: hypothetical protein V6D47_21625 [Oscillatoriaceae cyanobacterium]
MRAFVIGLLLLAIALPARAEVVDAVVASVHNRIIALSTLMAYRQAFVPRSDLDAALNALVDERLLADEARRYGQAVDPKTLAATLKLMPTPAGMTSDEWGDVLDDHLLSAQFLSFRFGDFAMVSRAAMIAYFKAHRAQFPGHFAQNEERIRSLLAPAERRREEQAYVETLRASAQVQYNPALPLTKPSPARYNGGQEAHP